VVDGIFHEALDVQGDVEKVMDFSLIDVNETANLEMTGTLLDGRSLWKRKSS
jgi:hypothetical protein